MQLGKKVGAHKQQSTSDSIHKAALASSSFLNIVSKFHGFPNTSHLGQVVLLKSAHPAKTITMLRIIMHFMKIMHFLP